MRVLSYLLLSYFLSSHTCKLIPKQYGNCWYHSLEKIILFNQFLPGSNKLQFYECKMECPCFLLFIETGKQEGGEGSCVNCKHFSRISTGNCHTFCFDFVLQAQELVTSIFKCKFLCIVHGVLAPNTCIIRKSIVLYF